MDHQHNWQLLSFILVTGFTVGWATGQLVDLLNPPGPDLPHALPSAEGAALEPSPSAALNIIRNSTLTSGLAAAPLVEHPSQP